TSQDGRDDVDDLGQVGDLDHVRVPDKAVKEAGHDQGVFQVVLLFIQMLGKLAALVGVIDVLGSVPDIPFVKAQVVAFRAAGPGLHKPAQRVRRLDLLVYRI